MWKKYQMKQGQESGRSLHVFTFLMIYVDFVKNYIQHTIFSLLKKQTNQPTKKPDSVPQNFGHGVGLGWGCYDRRTNISTRLFDCQSISRCREQDCRTAVSFIWAIPALQAENSALTSCFSGRCQRGYQTHGLRF